MKRLFFALNLEHTVVENLSRAVGSLPIRLERPENYHVTLHFLGATREKDIEAICKAAEVVARASHVFDFRVVGSGIFSGRQGSCILWAGVDEPTGALERLSRELGFKDQKFIPHITLGKAKKGQMPSDTVAKLAGQDFGMSRAREFALYESKTLPGGAVYQILKKFTLV